MSKITTLGDIFRNLETEEKAFKFLGYMRDMYKEIERLKEEYIMLQNASDEVEEEKDKEIEILHSIIKEVRERVLNENKPLPSAREIIDILDKENIWI